MSNLIAELEALQKEAALTLAQTQTKEASEAWYRDYLGRQGKMTAILRGLGQLPKEERPLVGQTANQVKAALESALEERQNALEQEEITRTLSAEGIDVTLPGRPQLFGKLHPTTVAMREIVDILVQMGFQVYDAPEVETDEMNSRILNLIAVEPRQNEVHFVSASRNFLCKAATGHAETAGDGRRILPTDHKYFQASHENLWQFLMCEE